MDYDTSNYFLFSITNDLLPVRNDMSPSPHPSPTRGEGIKPPPRNQRFRSSRKGWTFCAFSLLFTPSAIRHAVSRGSYFAGSTSVPAPTTRRWEGIKPPPQNQRFQSSRKWGTIKEVRYKGIK